MWRPRASRASQRPLIAKLLASVAPLVNTTASAGTAKQRAKRSRARVSWAAASRPGRWLRLEGLAKASLHQGAIACTTAGSQGVVA